MNNHKLKLNRSNNIRPASPKKHGKKVWHLPIVFAFILIFSVFSSVFNSAIAQQEPAESDTTNQPIDIPFYTNEFQGFSSNLSSAQIKVFGDYSVKKALIRIPGIQVSRDGDINIRGVGYDAYAVSLNGFRLSNTGMGNRALDLGSISTDAISSIEVHKVVDPSMDADALGGYVNLNTTKPTTGERNLSVILGGGVNSEYINRGGPSGRGWINYSDQITDEFSLDVNLNYQLEQFTREELTLAYGAENFGNGPVDVIEQVSPSLMNDESGRFSASVGSYFTPDDRSEYFFRFFFNNDNREKVKHQDNWIPNGDWIDQLTTGANGEEGYYSHEASHQNLEMSQMAFHAGGENDLESLKLSYSAGYTQGRTNNTDYFFPFMLDGLDFAVDMTDRTYPQFSITNRTLQVLDDGTVDRQFIMGQNFSRITEDHINDEYSARVDVEMPVSIVEIKAGASVRYSLKEGEFDDYSFEYYRPNDLRMLNFHMLKEPIRNIDVVNNEYMIPWFLTTKYAIDFLEDQRPLFSYDETVHEFNSAIYNYENTEQIYAAYVMGDIDFGVLKVKAGVRVEQTQNELDGNHVLFDSNGDYDNTELVTESADHFQLFPNLQLVLNPMEQNRVQLAYSRTIQRPNYFQQTPFMRVDSLNSSLFSGNHELTPVTADNIDLMIEQKVGNSGLVSVGGFYKSFSDLIVQESSNISSGAYNGFQEMTYRNSDNTATVYGAEVAIQQPLTFLPSVFSNLGLYANYTWSKSNYETPRGDENDIPGHSPHVINGALSYSQGRFFGQVKYHWSAELLEHLSSNQGFAPSVSSSPVYLDRFEDGYQDMSATINFKLSENFRLWGHIYNLLQTDQIQYTYDEEYYPTSTYVRNGIEFRMGIRYDL
ncbi:MAG: outer membrane beta-barrel protein [Gracilimonas sp.]